MSDTISDIVRDLRENAKAEYEAWQNDPSECPDGLTWSTYLSVIADRLTSIQRDARDGAAKPTPEQEAEIECAFFNKRGDDERDD